MLSRRLAKSCSQYFITRKMLKYKSMYWVWVPVITNHKMFRFLFFQERPQYTQITTTNIYLLIEVRHLILKQCHDTWLKKFKYTFESDILRDYLPKDSGVLRGDFWEFECSNDAQMACWLRLWMVWHEESESKVLAYRVSVHHLDIQTLKLCLRKPKVLCGIYKNVNIQQIIILPRCYSHDIA